MTLRAPMLVACAATLVACADDPAMATTVVVPLGPPAAAWTGPAAPIPLGAAPVPATQGVPLLAAPAPPARTLAPAPMTLVAPATAAPATASTGGASSGWGAPPAPLVDPRRFTEAHWQGLEVIPNSPLVRRALGIKTADGVIIDDVTLPADLQGFTAGGLIVAVGQVPTPDVLSFIRATERVADRRRAEVQVIENGVVETRVVTALMTKLGTANGETPSMIPAGARMPHPYRGPCTNCHRIGTTGTLPVDQGDLTTTQAPIIRAGARRPHRDRGPCQVCHTIQP